MIFFISRSLFILSFLIALLVSISALGGLIIEDLYRDNLFVKSAWLGADIVMLLLVIPILLASLLYSKSSYIRAYLVFLGVLDIIFYNYAFYLFGAAFNYFFMIYAAIVVLSMWALIIGLASLNVESLQVCFSDKTPVKVIAGWMFLVGIGLGIAYGVQWLSFVTSGRVPNIVTKTGHQTSVIFGLDLTLVIPFFVVGAFCLWRHRPWGYVIAAILNVKGAIYMIVMIVSTLTAFNAGTVDSLGELGLWVPIEVGCLSASTFLIGSLAKNTH